MGATPRDSTRSLWLGVLLVAAVAFGGAAALLGGVAPTSTGAPGKPTPLNFPVSVQTLGLAIIVVTVLWVVYHLVERARTGAFALGGRPIVSFLVAFLLAVGFVLVAHAISSAGPSASGSIHPSNNSTGGSHPPGALRNNSTIPPGLGNVGLGGWQVPGWAVFTGIVVAAVLVAVVVAPLIWDLRARAAPPVRPEARQEFADALRELESGADTDPRSVILSLYASLLTRVQPLVVRLEPMSPREIEATCVRSLRVGPSTARTLTGIFEEARYSTHPLSEETVARARQALQDAVRDTERRGTAR